MSERASEQIVPREDWMGSLTESQMTIEIRRCFNGVMVLPGNDASRCVAYSPGDVLVFQDMTQFWDWYQRWYEKTNQGAKA